MQGTAGSAAETGQALLGETGIAPRHCHHTEREGKAAALGRRTSCFTPGCSTRAADDGEGEVLGGVGR